MSESEKSDPPAKQHLFSGNIIIFHLFDIGDDINLEKIKQAQVVQLLPLALPKYFKNYHTPIVIERPHPHNGTKCISAKIHHFGALSLTYKIPFKETLANVSRSVGTIDHDYQKEATSDAAVIFKKIKPFIKQPKFFLHRTSYLIIQIDTQPDAIKVSELKEQYGNEISSMLRFETEALSEAQRNEILAGAIGYYRGDLIVVDTDAAFIYDKDYTEILDLFEFANLQLLELQYFDKILDQRLNFVYERKAHKVSPRQYLPFVGTFLHDPVEELGRLRVDISVITERLEGSVKLAGEVYYSEIYSLLTDKLDLKNWKETIDKKLDIIKDIYSVYADKINIVREDLLNVLIIVLIFVELVFSVMDYLK